jgi:hypothetical protein
MAETQAKNTPMHLQDDGAGGRPAGSTRSTSRL